MINLTLVNLLLGKQIGQSQEIGKSIPESFELSFRSVSPNGQDLAALQAAFRAWWDLILFNTKHFRRLLTFPYIDKRCINHVLQMRGIVLFDHLD